MGVVKLTAAALGVVTCLVLAAAPAGALAFTPPAHYQVGGHPADLASGDFNGDDLPDIAVAADGDDSVGILPALGNGRFALATRVPVGHSPRKIALGDLNGDGALDVVTATNSPAGSVSVLLGRGDGTFVLKGTYPTADGWLDLAIGDVTGDGVGDVVAAGTLGPALLAGDGDGGLLSPTLIPTGTLCGSVVLADFNLDGHLDLAATRYWFEEYRDFVILLSNGAGGFLPQTAYRAGLVPAALAVGSLNGDGLPDLVLLESMDGAGGVQGYLGDGLGTLIRVSGTDVGPPEDEYVHDYAGLAVGDLGGDGAEDVVTTVRISPGPPERPPLICVLCGHADGVYFTPTYLPAGRIPSAVVVDDFNGDGKDDFATSDSLAGSVSVRIKGTLPVIGAVSPAKGRVGAVITLVGRHFRKYRRTGFVRFGGTVATDYLSWSDRAIRVRVPKGTPKGLLKLTLTSIIGPSAAKSFARL